MGVSFLMAMLISLNPERDMALEMLEIYFI